MNKPVFTKSSVDAKLSEVDIDIFNKVVEKRFNEYTKLNKWFESEFNLNEDQYSQYQPYPFLEINQLENKWFTKACMTERFDISAVVLKNKVILKCLQDGVVCLEISVSKNQFSAINEKYDLLLDQKSENLYLIIAGTFMRNDSNILTTKLENLRVIKLAYK
jgi:hypothetical protein